MTCRSRPTPWCNLPWTCLIQDYRAHGQRSHLMTHLVFGQPPQGPWEPGTEEAPNEGTSERPSGGLIWRAWSQVLEKHTSSSKTALRRGFTQIPNYVLCDRRLSFGARLTYTMLLSYACKEGTASRAGADRPGPGVSRQG